MLKFEAVELTDIGMPTAMPDRQWGTLTVVFNDKESDHRRLVEIKVFLPRGADLTLGELAIAAQMDAQATLRAALEVLEKSTLPELLYPRDEAAHASK